MLEFYVESDLRLRQLRQSPAGEHLDRFADWLRLAGYKQRPAQLMLRAAAHLGHWMWVRQIAVEQLDDETGDSFALHLPDCVCPPAFCGRNSYHASGARRFIEYLRAEGIVAPMTVEPERLAQRVERFGHWMRRHRGVTEGTLSTYLPLVQEFVAALGEDACSYDASAVRSFILTRGNRCGHARTKSLVNAVRMFLRFLAAYGYCSPALIATVPAIGQWKLSSLPRYLAATEVERLVAVCDQSSAAGARDRAIILLLARLGLRAGDVRDLCLTDIDWSRGRIRVVGKGRRETWLPLPQDAGEAVLHYLEHFRPRIDDDHVFLRVYAPWGPLPSSGPISKLVRRAIQRAGVQAPSMGAHVLRHSAATAWLQQGVSLEAIGSVLRHRCIESTAHYAKVDTTLLREVTQPWPLDGDSPC